MNTMEKNPARTLSTFDFDPNHFKPGRIYRALTEVLTEQTSFSLDDLYRIGLILMKMKKRDIKLTALFINKWDTMSMCGQDEDMIQCLADLCDELVREILIANAPGIKAGQTAHAYAWLKLPDLVSDVFSYRFPTATAA